jgi:hypothetical protein
LIPRAAHGTRAPHRAFRAELVETYALGSDARAARPNRMTHRSSRTRRVARWVHAGVGRSGAQASPPVQGRVGQCPTGSKSRVPSRLKPRCRSACRAPASCCAPANVTDFSRRSWDDTRGHPLTRDETRCVVNAAGGRGDAVLHRVALLRAARGASCRSDLRRRSCSWRSTCGMQACKESTAARGVEARFLWKRFYRSRNDARP